MLLTGAFTAVTRRYKSLYRNEQKLATAQLTKLSSTQETIIHQKAELSYLQKELKVMKLSFYNAADIVKKVQSINNSKISAKEKPSLTEQEWSSYLNLLEETYSFASRLKQTYPRLTDIDIRICSLLREGVSAAHISSVMNIMPDTLSRRMLRIKSEKMNKGAYAGSLEMIVRRF